MRYCHILIAFLAFSCLSCVSTKVVSEFGILQLQPHETVLVVPSASLSSERSDALYTYSEERFGPGCTSLLYFPAVEYDLLAAGIEAERLQARPLSKETMAKVKEVLHADYLLYPELLYHREAGHFSTYTATELAQNPRLQQGEDRHEVRLLFRMYDLTGQDPVYELSLRTEISPLIINEEEGETRVNISDSGFALSKAYDKGMKQIASLRMTDQCLH